MKIAIVLSGNLRTFLMPTRENPDKRVLDNFIENIVLPNNADVFAFTDTNDFYYNDVQYYATDRRIEILNNNSFRIHNKIDFINNDRAKQIIEEELSIIPNLRELIIEQPFDVKKDDKFELLHSANVGGSSPTLLIHQFRKLKLAYNLVKEYEQKNNFKYDLIVKWRFDILSDSKIKYNSYDHINYDLYVAGIHKPIIYDWHSFGTREAMHKYLNLYDILGRFLNEGRIYLCDRCKSYGESKSCSCNANLDEITLAPEYHLFRMIKENNIRVCNSGYNGAPYRYNNSSSNAEEIISKLNKSATLINYTATNKINEKNFKG